jgi:hypothetical protein
MRNEKTIGILFLVGALGVLVPYTILTMQFDYPDVLRLPSATILARFHAGGSSLILTWWAFAILGLPLIPAYVQLGKQLEERAAGVRWATVIGVLGLVVQLVGLLRWTFVVPVLATHYAEGTAMAKEASVVAFDVVHQYGGVLLGEHLGQLFTIIWTIAINRTLDRLRLLPRWAVVLGYTASVIYLFAQTELFATVMPSVPVVGFAGLMGSTLWIGWLVVVGGRLLRHVEVRLG